MNKFVLHSDYKPAGDQPEAIARLTEGLLKGSKEQTLLGNRLRQDFYHGQNR